MVYRQANESVLETIFNHVAEMTPTERLIAQYITSNPSEVIYLTARELAGRVGVSDASVVRFCQSMGFSGFKELKLRIALATQASEPHIAVYHAEDALQMRLDQTFDRALAMLQNTRKALSSEHIVFVARQIKAARRVILLGAGTSGLVAKDMQIKLTRLGMSAFFDDQPQNAAILVGLAQAGDTAIAFSHSGNTLETVNLLRTAKEHGAFAVAVTNNASSQIAGIANDVLLTASDELPFHSLAMTSRLAQLFVVDALVAALIHEMGDEVQDHFQRIASAVTDLSHRGS